ncbi:hypothetical protein DMC30DRAFT_416471 [Rhodotorula diobovata]|uniref:Uncharacterized protein n=1 Tax=Rhodotorula diobovata TaxID=5288 RepID=A0A5C5FXD2_9BASI|nr:hypothetical protein DMC30DRAFT_416471 [Rhodotorula diobovata]
MRAGWLDGSDTVALVLCCLAPPFIVYRKRGFGVDLVLAFELTLLGWLGGAMMAVYVQYADAEVSVPRQGAT